MTPFVVAGKLDHLEKYYFNLPGVEDQLLEWNWFTSLLVGVARLHPLLAWLETVVRIVCVLFGLGAFRGLDADIDLVTNLNSHNVPIMNQRSLQPAALKLFS